MLKREHYSSAVFLSMHLRRKLLNLSLRKHGTLLLAVACPFGSGMAANAESPIIIQGLPGVVRQSAVVDFSELALQEEFNPPPLNFKSISAPLSRTGQSSAPKLPTPPVFSANPPPPPPVQPSPSPAASFQG